MLKIRWWLKGKEGSILFRLNRFTYFFFKGIGKKETEHYLFTLQKLMSAFAIYQILANHDWQPNPFGYTYKGQIYQCRKLLNQGEHQYHLRFYDDGKVTGHFELTPEVDVSDHLAGKYLRTMNKAEANKVRRELR